MKQILEIISFYSIKNQYTPPLNFSKNLKPGSTSNVKLWIIPLLLPRKIIPWAVSHSMNILSNDNISTGMGDKFYPSYIALALNPKRLRILSSGRKLIIGPCDEVSMIPLRVEKFGLIVMV